MTTKVEFRQSFWKKIADTRRAVNKEGKATVDQLGSLGVAYAKRYAPYFTGETAKRIVKRFEQKTDGPQVTILIEPKRLVNNNFDLVKWMHLTGGIHRSPNPWNRNPGRTGKHIRSGDPQFMYSTRNYLNKIKKGIAKGRFKNINIK